MLRIAFDEMVREFERVLTAAGLAPDRAHTCADIFARNSADGVASHGYGRVLSLARTLREGRVDPQASPERVASFGAWEQWDGNMGPGMLNAITATDRALDLAREYGMGCVALRNTNHWIRPGAYGWRAAEAGFVFMCWTNTEPNTPPWGGTEPRIGNNPIVLAVPRASGPVVLDIAMSQFSWGQTNMYARRGQDLPVPGGYDSGGNLTHDPQAIRESRRALPIGYWKGSGLSLQLDLMAALLSGGRSTYELGQADYEYGVSQVYIAFDVARAHTADQIDGFVTQTLDDVRSSPPVEDDGEVVYPGERALRLRRENMANGVPIDDDIWAEIQAFV